VHLCSFSCFLIFGWCFFFSLPSPPPLPLSLSSSLCCFCFFFISSIVIPTLFFFFFLAASTHLFLPLSLSSTVAEVVVDTPLSFWRLLLRFVWIERFFFVFCFYSLFVFLCAFRPAAAAVQHRAFAGIHIRHHRIVRRS
jgi:hypothetical protein